MAVRCTLVHPNKAIAPEEDSSVALNYFSSLTVELDGLKDGRAYKESSIAVWNAGHSTDLTEGDESSQTVIIRKKPGATAPSYLPPHPDDATQKTAELLFQRLTDVYAFYRQCFGRQGMNGRNCQLHGFVMYAEEGNAMYEDYIKGNGSHYHGYMAFGLGELYRANMATALDVVGHEATHGVVGHTTKLVYQDQSGALDESLADCFGIMMKHWKLGQRDPAKADWEFGSGLAYPSHWGMRNFENPALHGQPWHASEYNDCEGEDNGGVHHNSGILNHAFYLAVTAVGHPSWETVGKIWYKAMIDVDRHGQEATFWEFADVTIHHSPREYRDKITAAWVAVGVLGSGEEEV